MPPENNIILHYCIINTSIKIEFYLAETQKRKVVIRYILLINKFFIRYIMI